jgi:hypothetical protein
MASGDGRRSGAKDVAQVLRSYPRRRPSLTPRHIARYREEYVQNRSGANPLAALVLWLESWMHRKVASTAHPNSRTLELGAGTLNHLPYEPLVTTYDVVEPFEDLFRRSPLLPRIRNAFGDISAVPPDRRYDRVISIATLEHLTDLPWIVALSALHLDYDGTFAATVPSEGKLLWAIAWRSTTAVAYRLRTGAAYEPLVRYEHVNTVDDVATVLGIFFDTIAVSRFPTPLGSLSLYTAFFASRPNHRVAERFVAEHPYLPSPPPHQIIQTS